TLRELYFRPFEEAVKRGNVASVMCSYNKLNGTYTSAHKWLLTDVLRKDWGFKGFLMTDWGAAHETVGMFNGGMDIEMPEADFFKPEKVAP
ncbi:glycoside hydrolase family 3 N-terminal domain-containing protein, partial [Acinetobacter baumannii]